MSDADWDMEYSLAGKLEQEIKDLCLTKGINCPEIKPFARSTELQLILTALKETARPKHDFKTSEDCNCTEAGCMICDGGLALCKVCGLLEGALTTDCPGHKVPYCMGEMIYGGLLDYREAEGGWAAAKNPTNQTWEKAHKREQLRRNQLAKARAIQRAVRRVL